jgi:hypothetical protein
MLSGVALAAAAVVTALLAFIFWPRSRDVFTDADTISQSVSDAPVRDILWKPPASLPESINSAEQNYEPRLSADGLTLFFVRGKAGQNSNIFTVGADFRPDGPSRRHWSP